MADQATTVAGYLKGLEPERRKALEQVRSVIRENLDSRIEEGMQYGMIGYFVPHKHYPEGYHCDPKQPLPFAGLASQKNHMGLYMMCIYCDPAVAAWFAEAWRKTGKKLDMGKGCVRFKRLEDVPLDVVGEAIRRVSMDDFVAAYEHNLPESVKAKRARQAAAGSAPVKSAGARGAGPTKKPDSAGSKGGGGRKPAAKKAVSKKVVSKKTAAKKTVSKKVASKKTASKKTGRG